MASRTACLLVSSRLVYTYVVRSSPIVLYLSTTLVYLSYLHHFVFDGLLTKLDGKRFVSSLTLWALRVFSFLVFVKSDPDSLCHLRENDLCTPLFSLCTSLFNFRALILI